MRGRGDHGWGRGGALVVERSASLPPEPDSPREARRLFRDAVAAGGRDSWLDAGELAVSEVVTNAVLHAHTAIQVSVAVYDVEVCVEVRDANPTLPVARDYDDQASTGRGLGLVAAVACDHGVESLGADGKVIWFCISDPASDDRSSDDILEGWSIDDWPDDVGAGECATVVLAQMPPTLWLSARQHHDALLRELALYAAEHPVPVDFVEIDRARASISVPLARAVDEAHAAGLTRSSLPEGHPSPLPWVPADFDLELSIPRHDSAAYLALPDALDLAERLAISGSLLVRPGLPEIIAVRDWACEQVVAQLAGSPPIPWAGAAQERFETETNSGAMAADAADVAAVRDSDRRVVAADDANRIVAISEPLADALGWEPAALVGRRVVTLIPQRLREAHVAGFTRHLSTGEAHVLGVPLELPVLCFDGSERRCRFLIERTPTASHHAMYLAWIDPIDE